MDYQPFRPVIPQQFTQQRQPLQNQLDLDQTAKNSLQTSKFCQTFINKRMEA